MSEKCNKCGKNAKYFDVKLGKWFCTDCYDEERENCENVKLENLEDEYDNKECNGEIKDIMDVMEEIVDDIMKMKVKKLDARFRNTKYSNNLKEILSSMTKIDIKNIAVNLNYEKSYKYGKEELINLIMDSYHNKLLKKMYLFNDDLLKGFKYFSKNNGITILNDSNNEYLRFVEYFMSIGILYPSKNEEGKSVLIMPKVTRSLLSKINEFEYRLKIKNNSKIITLVNGMVNVYGVLTVNDVMKNLQNIGINDLDFKIIYETLNEACNYNDCYLIEEGYVFNYNIKYYKKLYKNIKSQENSIQYREYTQKELLNFGKENWLRNSKFGKEFIRNFTSYFEVDSDEIDAFLNQLYYIIQEESVENILDKARKMIVEEDGKEIAVKLIKDYICNLPIWCKKGKSINELKGKSV